MAIRFVPKDPAKDSVKATCREITLVDVEAVCRIEHANQGWAWTREQILFELSDQCRVRGGGFSAVLVSDAQILGYYFARQILDQCELLNLVVDKSYQQQGWGRVLLEHFKRAALARGAQALNLELRSGNTAALALYKSFGFLVVGERKAYYRDNGDDSWLMTAQLKPKL